MPLVESRLPSFSLLCGDMRGEMEVVVIDALDFKAGRKLVVVLGNFSASKNMHLRLNRNCRAIGETEYIDSIIRGEKRVNAMSKTACGFIGIESSG
jgi:hypothetical protein